MGYLFIQKPGIPLGLKKGMNREPWWDDHSTSTTAIDGTMAVPCRACLKMGYTGMPAFHCRFDDDKPLDVGVSYSHTSPFRPFLSCMVFKHLNTRKCEIHWANVLGTWWVKVETHGDPSLVIFYTFSMPFCGAQS